MKEKIWSCLKQTRETRRYDLWKMVRNRVDFASFIFHKHKINPNIVFGLLGLH